MLGIDVAFFLIELIVGSIVHSLALMADAFHMVRLPIAQMRRMQSADTNGL